MNKKIKILIAEHDRNDIDIIQFELTQSGFNYESKIVQTENDFSDALKNFVPDIILSDYTFPTFDGPTAFKIRERLAHDTPFIFVSGTIGEEAVVELIKNGVTDYALKDKLFTLPHKIDRALKEAEIRKEKSLTDEKLLKAHNLYAFISQVNQHIVRESDEATLFHNSCQMALDFGKFKMAWIGLFNNDRSEINLIAQSGMTEGSIQLFTNKLILPNSVQSYLLETNNYYICNDIENCIELETWKPFAKKHGIRSGLVLPIKKSGKTIGSFSLYSSELNFSGKEEVELLIEVASDISFALDLFEKEKKQIATDKMLLRNEARFRALIEKSTDMKTLTSKEGKIIYCSPSISKVFGYSLEEFLDISAFYFFHPDDLPDLLKSRATIIEVPGKSYSWRYRLRHQNGSWIWCEGITTNLLHEPEIQGFVTNFQDISGKKIVEEQQEFDRNNLDALINNTKDLMWSVDRDFNLITSNKPFDEMGTVQFGKPILKGENVLSVSQSPEMLENFKQKYERAFAGEAFSGIEHFEFPHEFWTDISYYPIRKGEEIIGTACYSRDITAIKIAESQLRKSEMFKSGVLNSLTSHIAVVDTTGDIVAVNNSWEEFALDNGETTLQRTGVGSNYFKVCEQSAAGGEKFAQEALQGMKDVMNDSITDFYLEYPCNSPSKKRWFSMRITKFDSDEPMIVVSHMDITERKLIEENFIQSKAYLAEAQRLAKMGSWNYDMKTNKLTWSEELYNVFDTDKQTFIETHGSFLHLIDEEDREAVSLSSKYTQKTGEPFALKYNITTAKGEKRVIQEYGYGEKDRSGNVIRLFGTAQDITEIKKSEWNLMQSEERLREAQTISHISNWEVDLITNICTWSDEFYNIFKIKREEVKPSPESFLSLLHPDDFDFAKKNIEKAFETLKEGSFNARTKEKDGEIRQIFTKWKFEFDKNNKPIRLYGILQDITERKLAEQEKEKMVSDIIQRSKNLEQFTYIISHNLRAPIANIMGIANVLKGNVTAEDRVRIQQFLFTAVEKLDETVKDLNKILQIRSEITESKESVDLPELVQFIKSSIQNLIHKENAQISCDFSLEDKLTTIKSYAHSIFYNLISNAIKYKQSDKAPVIRIRSYKHNNKTYISFKDNGTGIDLTQHGDKVFGLYKRFHDSIEGKGLGLFMVKTQIEVLGGSISIKSEPGMGTEFIIEFPN